MGTDVCRGKRSGVACQITLPFPSFVFLRFFRPHRLFHVLTRSRLFRKERKRRKGCRFNPAEAVGFRNGNRIPSRRRVLCGFACGLPHGVQEGLTPRRKGATSSALAGAHFSSRTHSPGILFFVFFRFFRPHRLFQVLTRSSFAEKNAKGAKAGASIRRRQSGSCPATTLPPSVACFAALRAASPWRAGRPHATTQRRNVFRPCWVPTAPRMDERFRRTPAVHLTP
jgi:hypothetical protein